MHYNKEQDSQYDRRVSDWENIEVLVLTYKKQFEDPENCDMLLSKKAGEEILEKFDPLVKKYTKLLRTGNINWNDHETRFFICQFIKDSDLRNQCRKKYQSNTAKYAIMEEFNFTKEIYVNQTETEVRGAMQLLVLILARRYKQLGRNFCSYIYNCFRYEVARYIKRESKDPLSFYYKKTQWTEEKQNCIDFLNGKIERNSTEFKIENEEIDIPGRGWISGDCSEIFKELNSLDREILVKYYLEEWKDKQIAKEFCMHINTVNQRRRNAAKKIAENIGINIDEIKRTRKSGKRAILPTE